MLQDNRERALPEHDAQTLEDYLVYLKHVALYDYAARECRGLQVLDLGCGEGYGGAGLAGSAAFVVAADYAFAAAHHAAVRYRRDNLAFVVCDAQALPFRSGAFGAVTSFEVIEHLPRVAAYLGEIKRVGAAHAYISTPNRRLRLLPLQKPWNRFHLREYDANGFARVLGGTFRKVSLFGVTATPGIMEIERRRVKQNPLVAYARMIAQLVLPRSLYDRFKSGVRAGTPPAPAGDFDRAAYAAADFQLDANRTGDGITLVGVCEP